MKSVVLLLGILFGLSAVSPAAAQDFFADFALVVQLPNYETFLTNLGSSPIRVDGYSIGSPSGSLNPAGWAPMDSAGPEIVAALGTGADGFFIANPSQTSLAELNPTSSATWQPGQRWSLGFPFRSDDPNFVLDAVFRFSSPDGLVLTGGTVVAPSVLALATVIVIPEPSTVAVIAPAGLLAVTLRARKNNAATELRRRTAWSFTHVIALAALLAAGTPGSAEKPLDQPPRFTALGDLAGGSFDSAPYGISDDGSVVVGYSNSNAGTEAFRWTRRGGMVGLGFPQAHAVSADGSVIAGYRHKAGKAEPVRWTPQGGLQGLGNVAGYEFGEALGASADGSVIVGKFDSHSARGPMAFHWTQASGIARLAPLPDAAIGAEAYAVSAEGHVVVGAIKYESCRSAAFRWTSEGGIVELEVLPGDDDSIANDVSADGTVVVGLRESSGQAFRWTQETGAVGLGNLPGGSRSCALGVSADGSTIVGHCSGEFGLEAFVWDAAHGMRSLRQLLMNETNLAASLRGWKLRSAMAVSGDGSVIAGVGINPSGNREAWIARLGNKPASDAPTFRIATR